MLITETILHSVFSYTPWEHWLVIGILSFTVLVFLLIRKKYSVYGAICFCLTVLYGLLLLDTVVLIRWGDGITHGTGFSLSAEFNLLIYGGVARRIEMLANVIIFVPFGFFLSEFLSSLKLFDHWHRTVRVTMTTFGLSLCVESLQLIFHLGMCEITDLVLNTVGGFVGGGVAVAVRSVVGIFSKMQK